MLSITIVACWFTLLFFLKFIGTLIAAEKKFLPPYSPFY